MNITSTDYTYNVQTSSNVTWDSASIYPWYTTGSATVIAPTIIGTEWYSQPEREFRPQPTPAPPTLAPDPEPVQIKTERRIKLR